MDQMTDFQALLPAPDEMFGEQGAPGVRGRQEVYLELDHEDFPDQGRILLDAALGAQLNRALAEGDEAGAIEIAYRAVCDICDALAAGSEPLSAEEGRVHTLVIEVEDRGLASGGDGTLIEDGTVVRISYHNWTVDSATAASAEAALIGRCGAPGPNAWAVL